MRRAEYIAFYKNMIKPGFDQMPLERMYNAIGQFILKLMDLNKMVIHADSGEVLLLFMNIGFACDYRIVADNTVYQNPNIELDVAPKGATVFFLSKMLGTITASRILLSGDDITAVQAHQLGLLTKWCLWKILTGWPWTQHDAMPDCRPGIPSGLKGFCIMKQRTCASI